jgi:hypothetical protein
MMSVLNVTENKRKKSLLLRSADESVFRIFEGLAIDPIPDNADPAVTNVYTVTKSALDKHFSPKKNVEFERYTFRLAKQSNGETIDAYHARLRSLVKYCEFPNVEMEIKSHIIQTCRSSKLRRRALTDTAMTLQQLVDLGRATETAERRSQVIESGASNTTLNDIALIRRKQTNAAFNKRNDRPHSRPPPPSTVCRNCGRNFPHEGGKTSCPAWGKECHGCHKLHHFRSQCRASTARSTPTTVTSKATSVQQKTHNRRHQQPHRPVHHVTDFGNSDTDHENNESYVFSLGLTPDTKQPIADVIIQGKKYLLL